MLYQRDSDEREPVIKLEHLSWNPKAHKAVRLLPEMVYSTQLEQTRTLSIAKSWHVDLKSKQIKRSMSV